MDLQNCLNFQRELLYLPPTVTQWQTLHNVTETLPTQRNLHAGTKKNKTKIKIKEFSPCREKEIKKIKVK